ncbi:unnamed protein product [Closterium sp. Naga37s-1]|nr:unnamed protein product [Closterium sp. Naga37s-1]
MGADAAAAASDVVPAEVRVGTVVLVGSLAQPEPIYFDYNRCVPVPEIAKGARSGGSGMADVLVWWDVFSERTMCNAVQLFASPDCSGAPAAKYQNTAYMSTFKLGASVKSICCVEFSVDSKAPPTCPSPPPFPCAPLPVHVCEECFQDGRISEVHPLRSQCLKHLKSPMRRYLHALNPPPVRPSRCAHM